MSLLYLQPLKTASTFIGISQSPSADSGQQRIKRTTTPAKSAEVRCQPETEAIDHTPQHCFSKHCFLERYSLERRLFL